MNFSKIIEDGYQVVKLDNTKQVYQIKDVLLSALRKLLNNDSVTLETYHNFVTTDEKHFEIQSTLVEIVRKEMLHKEVFLENIELVKELIGLDVDFQTDPYLRIARPNTPQDNIGYHRDMFYGNSAYEVSWLIPLVDLDENSALEVEAGSHKRGLIPTKQVINEGVEKGSVKHHLGVPYAPKIIDENFQLQMKAIPVNIGEVLLLSLGNIHGQEVNTSEITRWSIDARVVNSYCKGNTKETYYRSLTQSPAAEAALCYYNAMDGIQE